jgi:hypothetical protein
MQMSSNKELCSLTLSPAHETLVYQSINVGFPSIDDEMRINTSQKKLSLTLAQLRALEGIFSESFTASINSL